MLKGKNCVVIGGAKGIGRSIVHTLAREGSNVAFFDFDLDAGKRLEEELGLSYGVNVFFFNGDICMQDDLETFAHAVIGQFGKIDFVINNGCATGSSLLAPINGEEFAEELHRNFAVPYVLATMFRNYFTPDSSMINIVGVGKKGGAKREILQQFLCEGMVSFTKIMAGSYQGVVRINCVSPRIEGFKEKDKDMVATPFDVVKTVEFLCQEKAGFINGENLVVDGTLSKMVVYHGEGGWSFRKQ